MSGQYVAFYLYLHAPAHLSNWDKSWIHSTWEGQISHHLFWAGISSGCRELPTGPAVHSTQRVCDLSSLLVWTAVSTVSSVDTGTIYSYLSLRCVCAALSFYSLIGLILVKLILLFNVIITSSYLLSSSLVCINVSWCYSMIWAWSRSS